MKGVTNVFRRLDGKAESGQFLVLSFLLQESQTTIKQVMEETGFSKQP